MDDVLSWNSPLIDLVAAVCKRCRNMRTVASALQGDAWIRDITAPLSIPVILQCFSRLDMI
jgi:hypothetical protein